MNISCNDLKESERLRNICILAHVDHGKTTLVDNLISSNKIISDKNVGKVKYLDNREDEQKRQITMKSSSILLTHTSNSNYRERFFGSVPDAPAKEKGEEDTKSSPKLEDAKTTTDNEYMINIIDTPGHVDFSSEVSTCLRICDGALILIDCIEGMCSQTKIVLRQTWKEMIKTVLVINKIDKLITNENMNSISAYEHINNIIEQVNAYVYQLYIEENINEENIEVVDLEEYAYSPIKGNVLLCSSIHCWCVDMDLFALLFCKKLQINSNNVDKIKKYLWNQYYYNAKEKKIVKIPTDSCYSSTHKKKKNLFSLIVFDFLWKIYDITIINRNDEQIKNICAELNIPDSFLKVNTQQVHNAQNTSTANHCNSNVSQQQQVLTQHQMQKIADTNTFLLISILSTFLNLSRSIFDTCVKMFPSPKNIQESRLLKIYPSLYDKEIYKDIIHCATNDFTIIYISKYVCANLQNNALVNYKGYSKKNTFLAICKIYAGMLTEKCVLYVSPQNIKTVVQKIFICMGGDIIPVQNAYAGNIVAIYLTVSGEPLEEKTDTGKNESNKGHFKKEEENERWENTDFIKPTGNLNENDMQSLSNTLMNLVKKKRNNKECNIFSMNNEIIFLNKNITLANKKNIDSFILPFTDTCSTILHTIIEPKHIQDMNEFLYGLILLYTYDTSVDIDFNDKGEYILKCCGEIHMQKCIADFVNIYSNIDIKTSDASISIREGINENYIKPRKRKSKMTQLLTNLYKLYLRAQNQTEHVTNVNSFDTCEIAKQKKKEKETETEENHAVEKVVVGEGDINLNKAKDKTGTNTVPCNNTAVNEKKTVALKEKSHHEYDEEKQEEYTFKHIQIEKDNQFLEYLFHYSHNIIYHKLNNNMFYLFLSVLNMPNQILFFFDKHYADIQMLLENRCVSPFFLHYNKEKFTSSNEDALYKQCLINIEKCVMDLLFSDTTKDEQKNEYDDTEKDTVHKNSEKREDNENKNNTATTTIPVIENGYNSQTNEKEKQSNAFSENVGAINLGTSRDKMNYLKKNKNYHLQLWDIAVQNGSITLLFIKKYYDKNNKQKFASDNILTNEKYKQLIHQRNFVDTYISDANNNINIYMNNLCLGYKLASKYGPIAQEPIRGVMFIIEGLLIDELSTEEVHDGNEEEYENEKNKDESEKALINKATNIEETICPGNIIALMKEACLNAMQQNKLRIYEPMLRLNLNCECSVLGKVYNVLLKRRCTILSEEMKDGYFLYCIDAHLPLFNSFKLAEELRSKCSGNVIYDIQFSHWNKLNEEIFLSNDMATVVYDEDFDVKLTDNDATDIVNYIRKAKGLVTNEKIIKKPEKQCTLKK